MKSHSCDRDQEHAGIQPVEVSPPLPLLDFLTDPEVVRVVAEGERLAYTHLFNPAFATEISMIDPLPQQRIAVYDQMMPQPRLRFLLGDEPGAGKSMEVGEFLRAVRRLVVDFVVGRVLTGDGGDETTASGLDDVTTYYILHRHDFGMGDAPVGACILYAVSCNLSDNDLTSRHEILLRTGGLAAAAAEEEDGTDDDSEEPDADSDTDSDTEPEEGTGSTVKLRPWNQRKRKSMGYDEGGRPAPLIDQVHRLMLLWKLGDVVKVDDYLDARGLRKNALFLQLLQALSELAGEGTDERVILENLSNHLAARGVAPTRAVDLPGFGGHDDDEERAESLPS
jgi:hypothetical protein